MPDRKLPKAVRPPRGAKRRIAIVHDGRRWFVRHIATVTHDLDADHMVYRCDRPIGKSPDSSLAAAVVTAELYLAGYEKAAR